MQKRLTNHSNFAAKPIDNILFQSTKGNFLLPCNPDSHVVYPNTFVSDFLKFYPELFALPKSTWNYIVQFWYLDLSPTDSIIQECILSLPLNQDPFLHARSYLKNLADLSKKETWLNRQNMQMVFQDPLASFDPKMKIVDILTEPLINFGKLKKSEKEAKARELLEMVELPGDFVDRYPHNMSGGQRQRISIARALSLEPEILVCDEATSALDVSVQESVIELLVRLQKEKNISMLFICHDLALIRSFAHQIAVMYLGNIVEVIPGEDVTEHAVHPYTQALLGAQFSIHMDPSQKIQSIESEAPSPLDVPKGCPFQNRCEHCTDRCKAEMPKLKEIAPGHAVACFYVEEQKI